MYNPLRSSHPNTCDHFHDQMSDQNGSYQQATQMTMASEKAVSTPVLKFLSRPCVHVMISPMPPASPPSQSLGLGDCPSWAMRVHMSPWRNLRLPVLIPKTLTATSSELTTKGTDTLERSGKANAPTRMPESEIFNEAS